MYRRAPCWAVSIAERSKRGPSYFHADCIVALRCRFEASRAMGCKTDGKKNKALFCLGNMRRTCFLISRS